jgi:hypothetical protein
MRADFLSEKKKEREGKRESGKRRRVGRRSVRKGLPRGVVR